MRCEKCGAEWNGIVTTDNAKCPFCGEILSEDIPYKQVIDSLRMLVDRFGGEIYIESQRLDAMVNDLVPNALKEKNIIRSAISFNIPSIILDASKDLERRDSILEQAYHAIVSNGIDKEWCSAILFMLSYHGLARSSITINGQFFGAVLAAAGWLAFSWGFSVYIKYFSN